jgi:hypothetical protein
MTTDVASTDPTTTTTTDAGAESPQAPSRRPGSAPGWVVWLLIVLATVIAVGAGLNTWAKRQLLDTNNWVNTSDQLLQDPAIRSALSVYLVDQLYANVSVGDELASRLPDNLKGLAGPISAGLRAPATEAVDRLLATPQAEKAWTKANTAAHTTMVKILKNDTRAGVSTANGAVTLQLGTLVADLGQQIGLPSALLDRIPPDAGTIVVAQSDQLQSAQKAVRVIEFMSVFLFFLVLALYIAAVYFANDRRRALRNVGIALVIGGVILLLIRQIAVKEITNAVQQGDFESAIRASVLIGTSTIRAIAWSGIAIGVLLALYAVLVGPTRAAVAVRRGLAPLFANRLTAFLTAIVIIVVVGWLTPGTGVQTWYARLVLLVLIVVGVERLRALTRREHPDATWAKVGHEITEWFDGDAKAPEASVPDVEASGPEVEASVPELEDA